MVVRYVKAYSSLAAVIVFFLGISMLKGAGWKPLLIPLPLFLILFVGITYQLIKESRAARRKEVNDDKA